MPSSKATSGRRPRSSRDRWVLSELRRQALHQELGDSAVALLRTLKQALDPAGLLNSGVLIPDDPGPP